MKICGMDECGRGSFAGPLVAAGVIFGDDTVDRIKQLNLKVGDSKKLTSLQRERIVALLPELNLTYQIEEISVDEINRFGIGRANINIFERLIKKLPADLYKIDGNLIFNNASIQTVIHGDSIVEEIMVASIVAKVHRDSYMKGLHTEFPEYGWNSNVGYGTPSHILSLKKIGETVHHRHVFVQTALKRFS